jgi:hypothetical protein
MASWISVVMFAAFIGVLSLVTAVAREAVNIREMKARATKKLSDAGQPEASTSTKGVVIYVPAAKHERSAEAND